MTPTSMKPWRVLRDGGLLAAFVMLGTLFRGEVSSPIGAMRLPLAGVLAVQAACAFIGAVLAAAARRDDWFSIGREIQFVLFLLPVSLWNAWLGSRVGEAPVPWWAWLAVGVAVPAIVGGIMGLVTGWTDRIIARELAAIPAAPDRAPGE